MAKTEAKEMVAITPPNFKTITFRVVGASPYMQARFSAKAMQKMAAKQMAGSTASKNKGNKTPRDFDDDFIQAQHFSREGWNGIPAAAFRCACIDVCRMTGFKMTHAKMSIFIEADGYDKIDGTPLVKLIGKAPKRTDMIVRNATGVADIRVRPLWEEWSVVLRVRFDADQFTASDVANLLNRAGQQNGIGEGRANSRESNGMGFGFFSIQENK